MPAMSAMRPRLRHAHQQRQEKQQDPHRARVEAVHQADRDCEEEQPDLARADLAGDGEANGVVGPGRRGVQGGPDPGAGGLRPIEAEEELVANAEGGHPGDVEVALAGHRLEPGPGRAIRVDGPAHDPQTRALQLELVEEVLGRGAVRTAHSPEQLDVGHPRVRRRRRLLRTATRGEGREEERPEPPRHGRLLSRVEEASRPGTTRSWTRRRQRRLTTRSSIWSPRATVGPGPVTSRRRTRATRRRPADRARAAGAPRRPAAHTVRVGHSVGGHGRAVSDGPGRAGEP